MKTTTHKIPLPPEGESGNWAVSRFRIDDQEAQFFNLRQAIQGLTFGVARPVRPGEYMRLTHYGQVVMSNTPAEMAEFAEAVYHAHDHVLINGLGLGLVVGACLEKPEVQSVTVVELSPDVSTLTGPHYTALAHSHGKSLKIIRADATKITVPGYFGCVWHDIWATICVDNLTQMNELMRRYAGHCDWQGCWMHHETEDLLLLA